MLRVDCFRLLDKYGTVVCDFVDEEGRITNQHLYNGCSVSVSLDELQAKENSMPTAATNGDVYVPMSERTGDIATVYFTRDLTPQGLEKAYEQVNAKIGQDKVAVKLHTGEPNGPNIIPSSWIKEFVADECPGATIVETNTYYEGERYTTEQHLETLKINGWDFCPVDITDAEGTATLPVAGYKWIPEITIGKNLLNYDSLIVLTHFKGHPQGGFGGSNKNIGIGCADGRIGKKDIHSAETGEQWGVLDEELMERITESTKGTIDYFGEHITYVNVMRNMSVDCDCLGVSAAPVVTPNVGILSSTDICAVDTACVDIVWAMTEEENHDLKERIQSRHGLRQLSYMQEMGMGSMRYKIIDLDNDGKEITAAEAAQGLKPFEG